VTRDPEHGLPYFEADAKRPADKVPLQFDWHDYLANQWQRGSFFELGAAIRLPRLLSTGLEYVVTTEGFTGNRSPNFPAPLYDETGEVEDNGIGRKVRSGSVVFTARAITDASLRATIVNSAFVTDTGLTLSDESDNDLVHTVYAAAGLHGNDYEVRNVIMLSNAPGETKEAVIRLPVRD
jgi:hypothetical protein